MPRKPATPSAESPARCSSRCSNAAWRTRHRPVRVALDQLPQDLAQAAAGDATAVAFRTAGGDFGLVSAMDWPTLAVRTIFVAGAGYMYTRVGTVHDMLLHPPEDFAVHHRNGLKVDNRRRNIAVLRDDVHRAMHGRMAKGLRTGLVRERRGWLVRLEGGPGGLGKTGGVFTCWEIAACVRDDYQRHRARSALSVFDGTILDCRVPALFAAQGGRPMTFTFVDRQDGLVHLVSGIACTKGPDPERDAWLARQGRLIVWSDDDHVSGLVMLDGLLWVTAGARNLRVIHNRQAVGIRT